MFKHLMRSSVMTSCIGWLLASYMVIIKYTTRWDILHRERAEPIIKSKQGFIALTWHSRFLMLNSAWKKRYAMPHVLISRSRDGAIVAKTTHYLGLKTIRGSAKKAGTQKTKGGAQASRDIVGAIENGGCIVITPDGPRGPRQRLGDGPLRLAKLTGAPILPCTFSVSRRKMFNSWDKFVLPLPFGRGQIIWGTPVTIPSDVSDAEIEIIKHSIETEMNMLLSQADIALGHDPVQPK